MTQTSLPNAVDPRRQQRLRLCAQGATTEAPSKQTRHRLVALSIAVVLSVAYAVSLSWLSLSRHNSFRSCIDLAVYCQVIWRISRFSAPFSSVWGAPSILGDHFSPILYLLAPLQWIREGPSLLLIVQSVALAAGGFVLFRICGLLCPGQVLLGVAVTASYCLYGPLHFCNLYDFHASTLAVLPLFGLIYCILRRNEAGALTWAGFALLCDERIGPMVALLGVTAALTGQKRLRLALTLGGAAWTIIALLTVIFLSHGEYVHSARFGQSESTSLAGSIWTRMEAAAGGTAYWCFQMLMPLAFLPLLSPRFLVPALPVFAAGWLGIEAMRSISYHYVAPAVPFLFVAMAEVLSSRKQEASSFPRSDMTTSRRRWLNVEALRVGLVISAAFLGQATDSSSVSWLRFQETPNPNSRALREAASMVPDKASVSCQQRLLPHLSCRNRIYCFPNPFITGAQAVQLKEGRLCAIDERSFRRQLANPHRPDFVLLDDRDTFLPLRTRADYKVALEALKAAPSYRLLARRGCVWVFCRAGA